MHTIVQHQGAASLLKLAKLSSRSRRAGAANIRRRRLPVLKGGFCVSTVSIVCGRAPGSMAVVAGCIYWTRRRLARPRVVIVIADDADGADGADGIFDRRTHPDHPASGSAFTTEGNFDAQRPKERLRATQAAGERAGIFWPAGAAPSRCRHCRRSAPARRRSEALPVHELRSAMISRTQAATGSASIMPRSRPCGLPHRRARRCRQATALFRRPWPRARSRPSAAAVRGECRAVCAAHARPRRAGRPGCGAARSRTRATVRVSERRCCVANRRQGQENRAVGQIRPADDILDAIQEDRARRLKQHLVLVGVELPHREAAAAREPTERVGEPGRQAGEVVECEHVSRCWRQSSARVPRAAAPAPGRHWDRPRP